MDVDEQTEQTETKERQEATANNGQTEIASSSNVGRNQASAYVSTSIETSATQIAGGYENEHHSETQNISLPEDPELRNANDPLAIVNEHQENIFLPSREEQENAGIAPNYPLVLVRRVSIPNSNESPRAQSYTDSSNEDLPSANDPSAIVNEHQENILLPSREEQENEQHIENAGIDPNYPLVLVRRVSIPNSNESPRAQSSTDTNNEDPPSAMDQENIAIPAASTPLDENQARNVIEIFNNIGAGGIDVDEDENDEDEDQDENVEDVWSEDDEDEAAFLENPNFRAFANQIEAIRNMIAHTRRSMVEAEANFGPIPRNSLMQRFRRILFILNNRRRRLIRLGLATPDVEIPEAEASAEMEAVNDNDDLENGQSQNNDEPQVTMEQEEEINENAVRFDTNLPAEHSYLGANMNRVSGVNYLEVDQFVKLRLFLHQHVLFPGEVLPFMVDSSTTIIEGDIDAQNGILFGVCFPALTDNKYTTVSSGSSTEQKDQILYGVTCQIYELGEDDRNNTLIKSRALQRFVTKVDDLSVPLEYINSHPRMKCYGFVKILPDTYLNEPLKCINMGSMNRFRDNASMQEMYKRFQAATTPWPAHVYETHNISSIIEKARTQLAQHKIDTMPSDPTQLSYWLVRNLHLPENMLKSVFLANTVNTRLKIIASTFKEESIFSCRNCATHIADCRELFAMSKHGVQIQYCNSAGYIHETNTVYQVNRNSILYSGTYSTEFSWFPGYQWHIIVCKICKHHLGWEFKAVEPNLIPKQFFGISSYSVRVRSAHDRSEVPVQNAVYMNFLRLMNAGMNELREARNNMPNI